jgi:uncharacterized OB-fold protein
MTTQASRPFPALTPETEFFWTGGAVGELRFKRCRACGTFMHPPQPYCSECLSQDIAVEVVSGRAKVAAFTVNHHAWHPAFPPPYVIAIVEIEDAPGVRLTTQIVNCPVEAVQIGQPVQVLFDQAGPAWLPFFEPRKV